jgi:hypothetical protein
MTHLANARLFVAGQKLESSIYDRYGVTDWLITERYPYLEWEDILAWRGVRFDTRSS